VVVGVTTREERSIRVDYPGCGPAERIDVAEFGVVVNGNFAAFDFL